MKQEKMEVFEGLAEWTPWALGMGLAATNIFYTQDFPADDIREGEWSGQSGHGVSTLCGAVLAMNTYFILLWAIRMYKLRTGSFQIRGTNKNVGIYRDIFNTAIFTFAMLAIATSAVTMLIISDFNGYDVRVNSDGTLGGEMGTAMLALSGALMALGTILFVTHTVHEVIVRKSSAPAYVETRKYVL